MTASSPRGDKAFFVKPAWEFFELREWENKPILVPNWVFAKPLAGHDGGLPCSDSSYVDTDVYPAPWSWTLQRRWGIH